MGISKVSAGALRLRWWYLFFFAAVALVIAAFSFDADVQHWIAAHQNPTAKKFMRGVSHFGDWPEHVVVGVLLASVSWACGSKRWARVFLAMIIACAIAGAAARVVKIATGRARPAAQTGAGWNGPRFRTTYNAFPSGHTAASTAFFVTLALASWRVGLATLTIPALVAASRMYVAAHFFSDVLCAALLGIICAWAVWHRMLHAPPGEQAQRAR